MKTRCVCLFHFLFCFLCALNTAVADTSVAPSETQPPRLEKVPTQVAHPGDQPDLAMSWNHARRSCLPSEPELVPAIMAHPGAAHASSWAARPFSEAIEPPSASSWPASFPEAIAPPSLDLASIMETFGSVKDAIDKLASEQGTVKDAIDKLAVEQSNGQKHMTKLSHKVADIQTTVTAQAETMRLESEKAALVRMQDIKSVKPKRKIAAKAKPTKKAKGAKSKATAKSQQKKAAGKMSTKVTAVEGSWLGTDVAPVVNLIPSFDAVSCLFFVLKI